MGERQIHGFIFEAKYIEKNQLIKEKEYTGKFDARDKEKTPYQIKTIKKGSSIDLGDYFRNASTKEDFYLIVSFWEKDKDNIVNVYKLFIPHLIWNKILFFEEGDILKDWITNKVSNDYSFDEEWKQEIKIWKKKFGKRKIQLRFKRDHKSQRRIQCAINTKDFFDYFVKEFLVG